MTTESKAFRHRRATPLDAVNLYRLQVDEESKANIVSDEDQAARLMHILTVIETGYVSVVEISGRIVGSIGFAPGGAPYAKQRSLVSEWAFLAPSARSPKLVARLVAGVTRFADKYKTAIQVSLRVGIPKSILRVWQDQGFIPVTTQLTRAADNAEDEPYLDTDDQGDLPATPVVRDPVHGAEPASERDGVDGELVDDGIDTLPPRPDVPISPARTRKAAIEKDPRNS